MPKKVNTEKRKGEENYNKFGSLLGKIFEISNNFWFFLFAYSPFKKFIIKNKSYIGYLCKK